MNRPQFWILTIGSCLAVVFFVAQDITTHEMEKSQVRLIQARQFVNQNQAYMNFLNRLAATVYQVAQQTQDQPLKDMVTRHHIVYRPPDTNAAPAAPAASSDSTPSSTSAP
jgi:hypothetical protein